MATIVGLAPDCTYSSTMDMAVRLSFTAGTASLKLSSQRFNCSRTRSFSVLVPLRTRWESLKSRRFLVRAAEETEVDSKKVAAVKSVVPPFGENVVKLPETSKTQRRGGSWEDDHEQRKRRFAARRAAKAQTAARLIQEKLSLTARKKKFAENELAKLDKQMKLADASPVKENITDEERYMYMKLGLRMTARLLMGRRGVFDGIVENMHLHWKHRELVKIIFKGPMFEAQETAKILEVESGGILAGILTTSKGQAIIIYRGNNYQRPSELRPRHLLTKRQAMKRSLEMQRKRSLEQHILKLEKEIGKLQVGLYETGEDESDPEREGSNLLAPSVSLGTDLEDFDDVEFDADAKYDESTADATEYSVFKEERPNPRSVALDPIFKAQPLTRKERILLRQEALKQCDPMRINIGKSNMVAGLAKSIRLYFQKQPFAIVGVKGRAKGTPVVEIIQQIEEATGAVLVSREPNKLIIYRGWLAGEQRPDMVPEDEEVEEVPPELRAAIMREEVRDPMDCSYLTREECALVGIEYKGNRNEERDEEGAELDYDDEDTTHFDMWDDERRYTEIDNEPTGIGVDIWNEEKWYMEGEGEDEEEEEEDDEEAEIWSSKLERIEAED